jgi:hypothetical protein
MSSHGQHGPTSRAQIGRVVLVDFKRAERTKPRTVSAQQTVSGEHTYRVRNGSIG